MRSAVTFLLAVVILGVAAVGAHAQAPLAALDRCGAAKLLLQDDQRDLAIAQLKQALDHAATIECGARGLVDIEPSPTQPNALCTAAKGLADGDRFDEANDLYKKALDGDDPPDCAVKGLIAVAKEEKDKVKRDQRLHLYEVRDAVGDFVRDKAWPWPVALVLLLVLVMLWRARFPPKRIVVKASSDGEKFGAKVIDAANGAGGDGPRPAKLATVKDSALPANMTADLTALLRLPGSVPVGQFLTIPFTVSSSRLALSRSVAGGWDVADMTLRRPLRRTRRVRIALELGGLKDSAREEILALACGAWLVAVIDEASDEPSPVAAGDASGLLAHAYYRAGASRQSEGDTAGALACYLAMPRIDRLQAPFAWVNSRLNLMTLLASEGRWGEADVLARAVRGVPQWLLDQGQLSAVFGNAQLKELRRSEAYLSAIFHIDRLAATDPRTVSLIEAAGVAATALDVEVTRQVASCVGDIDYSLLTAMQLVSLCHTILASEAGTIDGVRALLALGAVDATQIDTRRPALGAVAHYDAACAVSLLLARLPAGDEAARGAHREEGVSLLKTAIAATPERRLVRVRAMARADAMLAALRHDGDPNVEREDFTTALGDPPPAAPDKRLAVELTSVPAS